MNPSVSDNENGCFPSGFTVVTADCLVECNKPKKFSCGRVIMPLCARTLKMNTNHPRVYPLEKRLVVCLSIGLLPSQCSSCLFQVFVLDHSLEMITTILLESLVLPCYLIDNRSSFRNFHHLVLFILAISLQKPTQDFFDLSCAFQ